MCILMPYYMLNLQSITGFMVATMLAHLALPAFEGTCQGFNSKTKLAISILPGIETKYQILKHYHAS
jgi:hypothetical protein